MVFRCDRCKAQYKISDEKIGKHGVKVRCKKCGHVITVRPAKVEEQHGHDTENEADDKLGKVETKEDLGDDDKTGDLDQDSSENLEAMRTKNALDIDDEELGSALDNLLSFQEETEASFSDGDEDEGEQSTRVFTHDELLAVHEEKEKAAQERAKTEDGSNQNQQLEWYAAINDHQVGPIRLADLTQRCKKGELSEDSLVWRSGFSDWTPMADVTELGFLFDSEQQPSARSNEYPPESEGSEPSIVLSGVDGEYVSSEGDDDIWFQDGDQQLDSDADGQSGMEWKPSAFSNLTDLAEEELAGIKAKFESEDNESLMDDGVPFGSDDEEVRGLGVDEDSIVGQITAEEHAAAKGMEEEKQEEGKRLEEEEAQLRRKAEEERKAAQQAELMRQQEMQLEQERDQLAQESQIQTPVRSGIPKWAIGAIVSCVFVILGLSMFIFYSLGRESSTESPSTKKEKEINTQLAVKQEKEPVVAASSALQSREQPTGGENQKPAGEEELDNKSKPIVDPASDKTAERPKIEKPKTIERKIARSKVVENKSYQSRKTRRKVAVRESRREERTPPPSPEIDYGARPVQRKSSSSILDFEDEKAFADATGQKKTIMKPIKPKPRKKVLPPLSQSDVMEVMRGRLAEFKACTRLQKERDQSVSGKMVVTFVIETSGQVRSAKVSTRSFRNTFFGGCITKIISQLRFPKFGGKPKTVPFPFTIK